jgi:hypothetical protein
LNLAAVQARFRHILLIKYSRRDVTTTYSK